MISRTCRWLLVACLLSPMLSAYAEGDDPPYPDAPIGSLSDFAQGTPVFGRGFFHPANSANATGDPSFTVLFNSPLPAVPTGFALVAGDTYGPGSARVVLQPSGESASVEHRQAGGDWQAGGTLQASTTLTGGVTFYFPKDDLGQDTLMWVTAPVGGKTLASQPFAASVLLGSGPPGELSQPLALKRRADNTTTGATQRISDAGTLTIAREAVTVTWPGPPPASAKQRYDFLRFGDGFSALSNYVQFDRKTGKTTVWNGHTHPNSQIGSIGICDARSTSCEIPFDAIAAVNGKAITPIWGFGLAAVTVLTDGTRLTAEPFIGTVQWALKKAPAASTASAQPSPTDGSGGSAKDRGSNTGLWLGLAGVLLALLAGAHVVVRRRNRPDCSECERRVADAESVVAKARTDVAQQEDAVRLVEADLAKLDQDHPDVLRYIDQAADAEDLLAAAAKEFGPPDASNPLPRRRPPADLKAYADERQKLHARLMYAQKDLRDAEWRMGNARRGLAEAQAALAACRGGQPPPVGESAPGPTPEPPPMEPSPPGPTSDPCIEYAQDLQAAGNRLNAAMQADRAAAEVLSKAIGEWSVTGVMLGRESARLAEALASGKEPEDAYPAIAAAQAAVQYYRGKHTAAREAYERATKAQEKTAAAYEAARQAEHDAQADLRRCKQRNP